jgi:cardiolipin synthase A/B
MTITGFENWLIPFAVSAFDIAVSGAASAHVILNKRDTKSAIGWIGLIWLSPLLGTGLYVLLGINRITRKARSLRRGQARHENPPARPCPPELLEQTLTPANQHLVPLARLVEGVARQPLLAGNEVEILDGGDQAYPAMVRAIDEATRSITLSTYIFNNDRAGTLFVDALGRAVARGVEVRVLIDGVGKRYSWPSVIGPLKRAGVPVAVFLPTFTAVWFPYFNLRNHRKILVIDGRVGFTGGMNILEDYSPEFEPRRPKRDLHFRIRGPAVSHMQRVFADDWIFSTDEPLRGEPWFPAIDEVGEVLARGVSDGPDDDRDNLLNTILGALSCAESSVAIVTPYFLPDSRLVSALELAVLRGVRVDILLPRENNHKLVQWAATAELGNVLGGGCHVWSSPLPFDHSKLMIVDRTWTFLGSANLDPRSLRLNFELNLECYDLELAARLDRWFRERLRDAVLVTADSIEGRSLPVKLRDGTARLLSPYL